MKSKIRFNRLWALQTYELCLMGLWLLLLPGALTRMFNEQGLYSWLEVGAGSMVCLIGLAWLTATLYIAAKRKAP